MCSGPTIGSDGPISFVFDASAVFRVAWATAADAGYLQIKNPNRLNGWQVAGQLPLTLKKRVVQANLSSTNDGARDPESQSLLPATQTRGMPENRPRNIFPSPVQTQLRGTSKLLKLQPTGLFQVSAKIQVVQAPISQGLGTGRDLSRQSLFPGAAIECNVMGTRRSALHLSDWASQGSKSYGVTGWMEKGLLRPGSQEWGAWVGCSLARTVAQEVEARGPFTFDPTSGGLRRSSETHHFCLAPSTLVSTSPILRTVSESLFQVDGGETARWGHETTNEDAELGGAGQDLYPTESPGRGLPSDRREFCVCFVQGHSDSSSHSSLLSTSELLRVLVESLCPWSSVITNLRVPRDPVSQDTLPTRSVNGELRRHRGALLIDLVRSTPNSPTSLVALNASGLLQALEMWQVEEVLKCEGEAAAFEPFYRGAVPAISHGDYLIGAYGHAPSLLVPDPRLAECMLICTFFFPVADCLIECMTVVEGWHDGDRMEGNKGGSAQESSSSSSSERKKTGLMGGARGDDPRNLLINVRIKKRTTHPVRLVGFIVRTGFVSGYASG